MQTSVSLAAVRDLDAAPRRLSRPWLWLVRSIWLVLMALMAVLIVAVIVNTFRWSAERTASIGADFTGNERNEWTLVPALNGAAAADGIQIGDVLVAVDDLAVNGDTPYVILANHQTGAPGAAVTLSVRGTNGEVTTHTVRMRTDTEGRAQFQESVGLSIAFWAVYNSLLEGMLLLTWLATAVLLFWRRSDDWLVAWISLALVLVTVDLSYLWWQWQVVYPQWVSVVGGLATLGAILALPAFYLFPDGRFVPRWTALLAGAWVAWIVAPKVLPDSAIPWSGWPEWAFLVVSMGWYATGILAQVYRYRQVSTPVQRQQIKWVIFGLAAAVLARYGWELAFTFWPVLNAPGWPNVLMWTVGRSIYGAALLVLPISFGIAILRHRLWDIDLVINRTLVYGALTVSIVGIYILVAGLLDVALKSQGGYFSDVLAIGLDIALVVPLRDRLQRGIDRVMFGAQKDTHAVLSELGRRLEAAGTVEAALQTITGTLVAVLKVPYAAIALKEGDAFRVAAAEGERSEAVFTWPLVYQQATIGQLILAPAVPGQPLTAAEWALVEGVALHARLAAHDALLGAELERLRAVAARLRDGVPAPLAK